MYKVFPVAGGWQIFYCPSAPLHYDDKRPYDDRVYTHRNAAHRRCKRLNQIAALIV